MTEQHLNDEQALDLALGAPGLAGARAHAEACAACTARSAEVRAAWELANATRAAEVEPGELFWRRQRGQIVASALAQRAALQGRRLRVTWALSVAATLLLALAVIRGVAFGPTAATPTAAALPAWTPLPPTDDDPAFALVAEAVPILEDEGLDSEDSLLLGLDDSEGRLMAEALRDELGRDKS